MNKLEILVHDIMTKQAQQIDALVLSALPRWAQRMRELRWIPAPIKMTLFRFAGWYSGVRLVVALGATEVWRGDQLVGIVRGWNMGSGR